MHAINTYHKPQRTRRSLSPRCRRCDLLRTTAEAFLLGGSARLACATAGCGREGATRGACADARAILTPRAQDPAIPGDVLPGKSTVRNVGRRWSTSNLGAFRLIEHAAFDACSGCDMAPLATPCGLQLTLLARATWEINAGQFAQSVTCYRIPSTVRAAPPAEPNAQRSSHGLLAGLLSEEWI
jgi:hypothetical protein